MPHHKVHSLLVCLTILIQILASTSTSAQISREQTERRSASPQADVAIPVAVTTDEPKETIVLNIWLLTLSHSAKPEADELSGELQDKANNLPAVIGTPKDVRDLIGRLKISGLLRKSREFRILALDGHTASAQSGADQPRVTGTARTEAGTMNTITMRSVGTIIRATPLIDTTGVIQIALEFNASHIDKSDEVAISELTDRKPMMADVVSSKQLNTIVRVKSGMAVLVGSDATHKVSGEETEGETELIILAATKSEKGN